MRDSGLRDGHIVFIGSTLSLMVLPGYAQYSPTKYALRGLAETLRLELAPLNIHVHIYYVATIHSPGYEIEQLTKPAITMLLEGQSGGDCSTKARAQTLLNGMIKGRFAICSDWLTDLIYASTVGMVPREGLGHVFKVIIGWFFIPVWLWWVHKQIKASKELNPNENKIH